MQPNFPRVILLSLRERWKYAPDSVVGGGGGANDVCKISRRTSKHANQPASPSGIERLFLSLIVGMGKRDATDCDREREGRETFWHGHTNNVCTASTAREVCNGRKPLLTKIKNRPEKDPSPLFQLVCGVGVQSRVCANALNMVKEERSA